MKNPVTKYILIALASFSVLLVGYLYKSDSMSGAPPYGLSENTANYGDLSSLVTWERPAGPPKVAVQVGHYQNDELPDELKRLRDQNGASAGGFTEVEVNLEISQLIADMLRKEGVEVEILPATVPANYWADVFLAIHADGSENTNASGYKFATSWRDVTGNAQELIQFLRESYEDATGFTWDDNITRNMRGYYAFAWWRYEHSIHPMTTPVIVELGYLTNPSDRRLLTENPKIPANALAEGTINYLKHKDLLKE